MNENEQLECLLLRCQQQSGWVALMDKDSLTGELFAQCGASHLQKENVKKVLV